MAVGLKDQVKEFLLKLGDCICYGDIQEIATRKESEVGESGNIEAIDALHKFYLDDPEAHTRALVEALIDIIVGEDYPQLRRVSKEFETEAKKFWALLERNGLLNARS